MFGNGRKWLAVWLYIRARNLAIKSDRSSTDADSSLWQEIRLCVCRINPTTYDQMLIVMKPSATGSEIDAVVKVVEAVGFRAHPMPGATRTAIGITGNEGPIDVQRFENLAGVAEIIRVTKPYKLITLDLRPDKTVVRVGDATIGDGELAIIAGPCAIENREQAFAIAEIVQQSGARFFRGCVWKPRTSPYTFQGLGDKGWEIV